MSEWAKSFGVVLGVLGAAIGVVLWVYLGLLSMEGWGADITVAGGPRVGGQYVIAQILFVGSTLAGMTIVVHSHRQATRRGDA